MTELWESPKLKETILQSGTSKASLRDFPKPVEQLFPLALLTWEP